MDQRLSEMSAHSDQEMMGSNQQFSEVMESDPVQDTYAPQVNKRVNPNAFQNLKVPESKKRMRPAQNPIQSVPLTAQGEG